jgi:peroxiredoxin
LKRLDIGRVQLTGAGIQTLKEFKSLEYLQFPQGVNDEDLAAIKGLDSLEELWIQNSPITNKGLSYLSDLKSLRKLLLHNGLVKRNMEVTGSGLAYLKELPSFTSLYLYQLKLDESRLTHLAELKQLEELDVKRMPLRDEDLAVIGKLTKLKHLFFDSETVSDGGMAYLAGLTALEDFAPRISMTDVGLSYLANMNKLERLQVKGDFTDRGLSHLERLKALRTLRITSGNDFSPAKLEQLQKELPVLQRFYVNKSRVTKSRPNIGEVAPKFSLKTLDGKEIQLEEYRGKVVLLYFWGTWCSPCVASTPGLKKLYEQLCQYDGFAMIALAIDNDEFRLRRHIEQYGLTWPQVRLGLNSQVAADYGISGVPAYILVGLDGKVLLSQERNWDKLKAAVTKALRK